MTSHWQKVDIAIREALLTHTNAEYTGTEKASNSDVCSNFLIEK
jgi:hypothetical protein